MVGGRKARGAAMLDEPLVDDEMEPNPELNRITNLIIGAAIEVHTRLGPGHAEDVYQNALCLEFDLRGIYYFPQHPIVIMYKGRDVGRGRLNFLVENQVIVEIKSVEKLAPVHTAQVIAYLKATRFRLGLLLNFNVPQLKEGIKRIAL
jgi:GxxExxY protein